MQPRPMSVKFTVAVGFGLLFSMLAVGGCADSKPENKSENATLKASMEKSMEIYKSKVPGAARKGTHASLKQSS